jgi:hypothetical protein
MLPGPDKCNMLALILAIPALILTIWTYVFAIPWPTFRIITNGQDFRFERHVVGSWYHPIYGYGATNIDQAREMTQKFTDDDKRIDAVNDQHWKTIQ